MVKVVPMTTVSTMATTASSTSPKLVSVRSTTNASSVSLYTPFSNESPIVTTPPTIRRMDSNDDDDDMDILPGGGQGDPIVPVGSTWVLLLMAIAYAILRVGKEKTIR